MAQTSSLTSGGARPVKSRELEIYFTIFTSPSTSRLSSGAITAGSTAWQIPCALQSRKHHRNASHPGKKPTSCLSKLNKQRHRCIFVIVSFIFFFSNSSLSKPYAVSLFFPSFVVGENQGRSNLTISTESSASLKYVRRDRKKIFYESKSGL